MSSQNVEKRQNHTSFFEREDERAINEHACKGEITEKECLEGLKDMGTEKIPGTDGLSAEFYKVFWNDTFEILATYQSTELRLWNWKTLNNPEKRNYQINLLLL